MGDGVGGVGGGTDRSCGNPTAHHPATELVQPAIRPGHPKSKVIRATCADDSQHFVSTFAEWTTFSPLQGAAGWQHTRPLKHPCWSTFSNPPFLREGAHRGSAALMSVTFRALHNRSAMTEARGHVRGMKLAASTCSPHLPAFLTQHKGGGVRKERWLL